MPQTHLKNQRIRRLVSCERSGFTPEQSAPSCRRGGGNGREHLHSVPTLKDKILPSGSLQTGGEDSLWIKPFWQVKKGTCEGRYFRRDGQGGPLWGGDTRTEMWQRGRDAAWHEGGVYAYDGQFGALGGRVCWWEGSTISQKAFLLFIK